MKLQVAKKDLEIALGAVSHSMTSSGTDISSHFVFRADASGDVEVLTFTGRLFANAPVKCVSEDTDEVKAFTVEGARLLSWLKAVKDAALDLNYDHETKVVTALSPRGSMEFESLDPDTFPYWDEMWADVKDKGSILASRLAAGLSYARQFCYDKETKKPQLCLIECQNGILYSTDEKAITLVNVPGLSASTLRIHRNDVGAVLKFLGTCGENEVALMEHERALLFKRSDGAVFGESRFTAKYPNITVARDGANPMWWKLPKTQILEGIPYLKSGAAKEDNRLFFSRSGKDGPVQMGMVAKTGNRMEVDIPVIESGSEEGLSLPEKGFMVDHYDLSKVLSHWDGDTVLFGIHQKGGMGFVRFHQERADVDYVTACAWLR